MKNKYAIQTLTKKISLIREQLAGISEGEEDYTQAANYLMGIPLDSGHRNVPDDYKLEIYIRISRLLLEDEDFIGAEAYLNRAGFILNPETTTQVLQLQVRSHQDSRVTPVQSCTGAYSRYEKTVSSRCIKILGIVTCI